jgi:prepilin-type N-terminal cleavage/methylation domain-containing protein
MTRVTPTGILLMQHKRKNGFSLIECLFSMVLISIAFVALVFLLTTGTQSNYDGHKRTNAMLLADQVKSLTDAVSYTQLDAYNGQTITPAQINDELGNYLGDYQAHVTIQPVALTNLTAAVTAVNGKAKRVMVAIEQNDTEISRIVWIRSP